MVEKGQISKSSKKFIIAITIIITLFLGLRNDLSFAINIDLRNLVEQINIEKIKEHITYLTNFSSRFTGTEGFRNAAIYITKVLENYGYTPIWENYTITIPIDDGAVISIIEGGIVNRSIKAFPLLPNTVNPSITPPEGIKGKLIYGGTAQLQEFNGQDVDGSIVLLDYNVRRFWKNAAMLGAKAVIFIEPLDTSQAESLEKSLKIPISFPRVYIRHDDGLFLLNLLRERGSVEVVLHSKMHWENVEVSNIISLLPGKMNSYETIVISTHYDSSSPVPSVAPGATNAINVATLLEMARIFSQLQSLPRNLLFAFLSGHAQGMWGAREFVDKHFSEIGSPIKMMIGLDLSYEGQEVGLYARGNVYPYKLAVDARRFGWANDRILGTYLPLLKNQIGKSYKVVSAMFPTEPIADPYLMYFDTDPFTLAGGVGISFHTTNVLRRLESTPLDRPEFINYENLLPQIEVVLGCVYGFATEEILPIYSAPTRIESDGGFAVIEGIVGVYNLTTAWYDPFSNEGSIVHIQWDIPYTESQAQFTPGGVSETPTFDIFVKPDPSGSFKVKGVKPLTPIRLEAYVVNQSSGKLTHATDFGVYGLGKGYATPPVTATTPGGAYVYLYQGVTQIWLPVFEAGSITLFMVLDPTTATAGKLSIRNYNFYSHDWNLHHAEDVARSDAIVFVPHSNPTELLIFLGGETSNYPLAVLSNFSSNNPQGSGYFVDIGENLIVKFSPYIIAKQIYFLMANRLNTISQYHVYDAQAQDYKKRAEESMNFADKALLEKQYDSLIAYSLAAWSYSRSAYLALMRLIIDLIQTTIVFFVLMIPLCFIITKSLMGRHPGFKQLLFFISVFLILTINLYFLHPGFHIAFNVFMIIIAATISIFGFLVLLLSSSEFLAVTKTLQEKVLGTHQQEISRLIVFTHSLSIGVENIKKHKTRSFLTLTALILVTISMIALTSASFYTHLIAAKKSGDTLYNGFLIRDPSFSPQSEEMARVLEGLRHLNATITERTWVVQTIGFTLEKGVVAEAVYGLTEKEDLFTGVSKALIAGRFFSSEDRYAVILSEHMANALGKTIGDTVDWMGLKLSIIGIFKLDAWMQIRDLDTFALAPIKWTSEGAMTVPMDKVLIVPYSLLMSQFNYFPYSIAVKIDKPKDIFIFASDLALQMAHLTIYAGCERELVVYSPVTFYSVTGGETLSVPFIVTFFIVLNVMLTSVYERIKEIYVYSTVGADPRSISLMFLTEATIIGVASAGIGYELSLIVMAVMDWLNLFPKGLYLNYASTFAALSVLIIIAITISSTLFPALKASKLVTPSLMRKWRIPTEPKGDLWNIPLPFNMNKDEARAMMIYMAEYLAATISSYGVFMVEGEISFDESSNTLLLNFQTRLAPYDQGIVQNATLIAQGEGSNMTFALSLKRLYGEIDSWILANHRFVDRLRKQFLYWRALPTKEKEKYFAVKFENVIKGFLEFQKRNGKKKTEEE
jgi:ABC-type antimicrobial peptide transport system permease subunit